MGSPVSPVVANFCMEIIEESAMSASATPPKVWKRFVDDSFVIIKKNPVSTFHDTLNSIDPKISFTIETEHWTDILLGHPGIQKGWCCHY